jgi:hypothetical protein
MGEWRYSATHFEPGYEMFVSGQFDDPDGLPLMKSPSAAIG